MTYPARATKTVLLRLLTLHRRGAFLAFLAATTRRGAIRTLVGKRFEHGLHAAPEAVGSVGNAGWPSMENSGVVGSDQRTEDPVPNPFRFDSIPSFFLALLSVRSVMSSSTASASTSELGRGASARISRRKSVAASKREDSGRPARTFAAVATGSSPCHAIPGPRRRRDRRTGWQ